MADQKPTKAGRSRVKRDSRLTTVLMIALVAAISVGIYLYLQGKHFQLLSVFDSQAPSPPVQTSAPAEETPQQPAPPITPPGKSGTPPHVQPSGEALPSTTTEAARITSPAVEQSGEQPQTSLPGPQSAGAAADQLERFFAHLDEQAYMSDFHLPEKSRAHFTKIIQKLLEQPPAITRETDDYFTLLKNTAHFFRIIGKENTLALKGILDRERNSLEPILQAFYVLTEHPQTLRERFALEVAREPLYDYACFFLNTIGGRLYLFRRDAASRMVVSYYAIVTIDTANSRGYNRLGIDLRPFVDALIEEMESAGGRLRYKETYLDRLYDLKERYGTRG